MKLAMNALQDCPSDACRRRALAHGRICPTWEPDEEYPARCPMCSDTVAAVGSTIRPHRDDGRGRGFPSFPCQGEAAVVQQVAA